MIEERARVVSVEPGGAVWVEAARASTCGGCAARGGCGSALLARVLGQRRARVRALGGEGLAPGDAVLIGIPERALVRGSLALYAVPLLLMLAGALAGEYIAELGLAAGREGASVLAGLGGLGLGLLWLRRFGRRIRDNLDYQPVVLRRLDAGAVAGDVIEPKPTH